MSKYSSHRKGSRFFMIWVFLVFFIFGTGDKTAQAIKVDVLENLSLQAVPNEEEKKITLTIESDALLNVELNLRAPVYAAVRLPEEIADSIERNVGRLEAKQIWTTSLLGITGSRTEMIDGIEFIEDGIVLFSFNSSLSLNVGELVKIGGHRIELTIQLDEFPPTASGQYNFETIVSRDDFFEVLMVSLFSDNATASASLTAPLLPPEVEPVTDLSTVIRGQGYLAARVQLLDANGELLDETLVNPETGQFSFELSQPFPAQTILYAKAYRAENAASAPTQIVVSGTLSFAVPETLAFQTTVIGNEEVTIPRQNPDWGITLRDTREPSSPWSISARIADGKNSPISDYLIFTESGQVTSLRNSTTIIEGTTGESATTTITWPPKEGILMRMNPMQAGVQPNIPYSTTIQWTLTDAP